ncbi:hypothetical protein [Candidatus Laterigemmans baculatus]|uniref:hypothetical protein n=1 Tax=Candidatus Laterigemmans baculatus TaxID=2770505 RepID=UPI0013DCD4DD|nr:hypothetical protein [Candidatus Laterigemmans baculatus]
MPNATRFALWFRLAGRPLPTLLLAAQGLTLPPAAAQDAVQEPPAAVLRVARDQPRLDAPQSELGEPGGKLRERRSTSSRRTTPAPTLNSPGLSLSPPANTADTSDLDEISVVGSALKASPPTASEPSSAEPTAVKADGWVSRGMSRQRLPVAAAEEPAASVATRPMESRNASPAEASRLNSIRLNPAADSQAPARDGAADAADEAEDADSSNARALALQDQIERFEAMEPEESSEPPARESQPRFVEIIPESIEPEPLEPEPLEPEPVLTEPLEPEPVAVQPRREAPQASTARPAETGERMPLRDPVIPGLAARPAEEADEAAELEYASTDADAEASSDSAAETAGAGPEIAEVEPRRQASPAAVISAAALRLKRPIEQTLQYYHQRPENSLERTPWGMLHAILPYGLDANIDAGRRRYNAIAWLAGNNPCRNLKLLGLTQSGRIEAHTGIGLQGHQAQLLAIFAQVGVPKDYPLYVGPQRFTVADLVQSEMAACRAGEELTFTLIGLSHYLPTDATWTASDGERWDFERLIREELQQPVVGAACGGTHRLMGLSYALAQRRREGAPITGQWERASIFVDDFVAYTWQLQNRDGSFSTSWFEGREDNGQLDRKVQTSGHILEWLIFTASDEQLQDDRMIQAITFLTRSMLSSRGHEWQVGPKGHALRALSLYHRRVFESERPWRASQTAAGASNHRR